LGIFYLLYKVTVAGSVMLWSPNPLPASDFKRREAYLWGLIAR